MRCTGRNTTSVGLFFANMGQKYGCAIARYGLFGGVFLLKIEFILQKLGFGHNFVDKRLDMAYLEGALGPCVCACAFCFLGLAASHFFRQLAICLKKVLFFWPNRNIFMNNKLYVGNISFRTDENSLEQVFAAHGDVRSVKIITNRDDGRSRGFGFVEMETDDAAQDCIKNLDGKEIEGRALRVSLARGRSEGGFRDRPPRDRGPRGGGGRSSFRDADRH